MDVEVTPEVHIVLITRHQDAVSRLSIGLLLSVAVATSEHEDQKHSHGTRVGRDGNDRVNVTSGVVHGRDGGSFEHVSFVLHAGLPGSSAVSGVPVIQEGVVEVAAEFDGSSDIAHDGLLVINANEEVVTGVQFELSF